MTDWRRLIEEIKPYIVKIETPSGSGTGFQIGEDDKWDYAITVTAHHVIAFAEQWGLPIKITREAPSESLELPPAEPGRSRIRRTRQDASSLFLPVKRHLSEIALHPATLPVGTEVGWLGYPGSVSGGKLAFSLGGSAWCFRRRGIILSMALCFLVSAAGLSSLIVTDGSP